jgi:hypothetical protein
MKAGEQISIIAWERALVKKITAITEPFILGGVIV